MNRRKRSLLETLISLLVVASLAGTARAAGPTISGIGPTRAPVGASVVLRGSGLALATAVRFNGVQASFEVEGPDSHVTAVVPERAASGPVTIQTPNGTATSATAFTIQPNIVLILTDDMRYEQTARMPWLATKMIDKGETFQRGYVVNPLCCPSRTSVLTGKYSHSTDVYTNLPPHGGFETFTTTGQDASTIATWLSEAGYRTGLVGKYLNGYVQDEATYVPPGWDVWNALAGNTPGEGTGLYYNYSMSIDGVLKNYGDAVADYSTTVLANDARRFIRTTPSDQPLFLYFAPSAPHLPALPASIDNTACSDLAPNRPPSYDEADVSDKPPYIRRIDPWTSQLIFQQDSFYLRQCRTLISADRAVNTILSALGATGRLRNTFIVFMSDNGNLNGEHRWFKKTVPYEEAIHVPFVVRYDPLTRRQPSSDPDHFVLNIDLAPTFATLAGVEAPGAEGASIVPLLDGTSASWRSDVLIEHANPGTTGAVPPYCALRNDDYEYVRYGSGEEELYDMHADPYQLDNLALDPALDGTRTEMRERVTKLCSPLPPGFRP
jgi:arylsulfatase A-like enzyme